MTRNTWIEPVSPEAGGFRRQAGGLVAISRWLSEATPPEASDERQCIPEGCQREAGVRRDFGPDNSETGCDPSGIGLFAHVYSGGIAKLNPRLIAGIPTGWMASPQDDGWGGTSGRGTPLITYPEPLNCKWSH
jgi:hypothetical protein